jgi:hypothetical protein
MSQLVKTKRQANFKDLYLYGTVACKKNGNCQNKIDTFLQFSHSVKPSYERYSLCQNQITTNTAFYPENQPATLCT